MGSKTHLPLNCIQTYGKLPKSRGHSKDNYRNSQESAQNHVVQAIHLQLCTLETSKIHENE